MEKVNSDDFHEEIVIPSSPVRFINTHVIISHVLS